MKGFIGRRRELRMLTTRLERVRQGEAIAVALRGRRQVGKSRLVQEFCDGAALPYLYFTATKGESPVDAVRGFCRELNRSGFGAHPVPVLDNGNWSDAFDLLATSLPDSPVIVVIDEVPWLTEQDVVFDGALQTVWDRRLSRGRVLLCLLGSDIHMMERFTAYDQPFYGRADNMVLGPLNPAETASAVDLGGEAALDAHLVSGGLPGVLRSWPSATPALEFLRTACTDPASPVFTVPEAVLASEFPNPDVSRRVVEAVGSGDRTHANIAAAAGGRQGAVPSGTLSPILRQLVTAKHVLAVDEPLSTHPGKPALYRVADSSLRCHLAALRAAQDLSRRGRDAAAFQLITRRWASWRGRAVEPLVREALERAGDDPDRLPWPGPVTVGGWWNRRFDPEIDLVGGDRGPVAGRVWFAGSVKWLTGRFDDRDFAALTTAARQLPGFTPGESGFVVVSASGVTESVRRDADLVWGPDEVLAAWA